MSKDNDTQLAGQDIYGLYDLPLISLGIRRVDEVKAHSLQIQPTHLRYHSSYEGAQATSMEKLEWIDQKINWRLVVRRDRISCISMFYDYEVESWLVEIEVVGSAESIKVNYPKGRDGGLAAKKMFDILETYHAGEPK